MSKLQRAFATGKAERVCSLISTAARKQVLGLGHGQGGQCGFDLFMLIDGLKRFRDWRERTEREVGEIVVDGDRATATVDFGDGQTASLPLVHERGEWRVDALFGGIPANQQEDHY